MSNLVEFDLIDQIRLNSTRNLVKRVHFRSNTINLDFKFLFFGHDLPRFDQKGSYLIKKVTFNSIKVKFDHHIFVKFKFREQIQLQI